MEKCFVIKDNNQGNLVSSIRKIEKDVAAYISYKVLEFGVYMMHSTIESALKKLDQLNQSKAQYGFDVEFHIEEVEHNQLIKDSLEFRKTKKDNMVLVEKKVELVCAS